jgi:hypothetical protein
MAQRPAETTAHETMTVEVINRLIRQYRADWQAANAELVDIEKSGLAEAPPLSDQAKATRQKALQIINGYADAADFALPPDTTRQQQLRVTLDALEMVVSALQQKETRQRAIEATAWLDRHGGEWNATRREALLEFERVKALVAKLAKMRDVHGMWVTLPGIEFFGTGQSIFGINWSADPGGAAVRAAIAEGLITARDLEAARNV